MSTELENLAQTVMALAYEPFTQPDGTRRKLGRRQAEVKIKGVLARIFRLGMDVGWEKAMALVEKQYPGTRDGTRKPDSWDTAWQQFPAGGSE